MSDADDERFSQHRLLINHRLQAHDRLFEKHQGQIECTNRDMNSLLRKTSRDLHSMIRKTNRENKELIRELKIEMENNKNQANASIAAVEKDVAKVADGLTALRAQSALLGGIAGIVLSNATSILKALFIGD